MSQITTSIKMVLVCLVLTISTSVVMAGGLEPEYRLGILIEHNHQQTMLTADPFIKHSDMLELYTAAKNVNLGPEDMIDISDLTVLWAGELEIIQGKITKVNETSGLVYRDNSNPEYRKTASLQNIETFIITRTPELAAEDIQFIEFKKGGNNHLEDQLESLSKLRHKIPGRMQYIIVVVEGTSKQDILDVFPSVLKELLADIEEIRKHCPSSIELTNGLKTYLQEIKELTDLNKSLQDFKRDKLKEMLNELRKLQYLENVEVLEIKPAPVIRSNFISTTKSSNTVGEAKIVESLQACIEQDSLTEIPDLTKELIKKIVDSGSISQAYADMIFNTGLYDYLKNEMDRGNNGYLLLMLGSILWDGYSKNQINLDANSLTKIYTTFAEVHSSDFIKDAGDIKNANIDDLQKMYSKMMTKIAPRMTIESKMINNFPLIKN